MNWQGHTPTNSQPLHKQQSSVHTQTTAMKHRSQCESLMCHPAVLRSASHSVTACCLSWHGPLTQGSTCCARALLRAHHLRLHLAQVRHARPVRAHQLVLLPPTGLGCVSVASRSAMYVMVPSTPWQNLCSSTHRQVELGCGLETPGSVVLRATQPAWHSQQQLRTRARTGSPLPGATCQHMQDAGLLEA